MTKNGPLRIEDFPSRITRSHLLLLWQEEIRTNIWPEIPWLKFVKKTSMPNSVESLGYIKCCSSSSAKPEALTILSDKTVGRSAVDQKDLKPYWKSEKRPHFSRWSVILLFTSFSKMSRTTERKLTGS